MATVLQPHQSLLQGDWLLPNLYLSSGKRVADTTAQQSIIESMTSCSYLILDIIVIYI